MAIPTDDQAFGARTVSSERSSLAFIISVRTAMASPVVSADLVLSAKFAQPRAPRGNHVNGETEEKRCCPTTLRQRARQRDDGERYPMLSD